MLVENHRFKSIVYSVDYGFKSRLYWVNLTFYEICFWLNCINFQTWLWMFPRKLGFDALTQLIWVIVYYKDNPNFCRVTMCSKFIETYNKFYRALKLDIWVIYYISGHTHQMSISPRFSQKYCSNYLRFNIFFNYIKCTYIISWS